MKHLCYQLILINIFFFSQANHIADGNKSKSAINEIEINNLVSKEEKLVSLAITQLPLKKQSCSQVTLESTKLISNGAKALIDFNSHNPSNSGFWESFLSGFSLIFLSELGDNTFILSIYFTIKVGALSTFIITAITQVLLNAVWLLIGVSISVLVYQAYINWIAIAVFLAFGIFLLIQGLKMDKEDYIIEEVEEFIAEKDKEEIEGFDEEEKRESLLKDSLPAESPEENTKAEQKHEGHSHYKSKSTLIWGLAVTLVFAECGDRSQITAITIGSIYNFKGVLLGSSLAHILCALLAVTIGMLFSKSVTERTLTLIGSALYFIYSVLFFYENIYADYQKK